jgi:branched-chain amino acid transport system substrate-binding protein
MSTQSVTLALSSLGSFLRVAVYWLNSSSIPSPTMTTSNMPHIPRKHLRRSLSCLFALLLNLAQFNLVLSSIMLLLPESAQAEPVLKIVSSLPRTGSANAQTGSMVNGITMALEEIGGKLGNYTIKYEDWDDASPERGQWDPAVEAANADRAVKDPQIVAYIGTYNSGAAKISMPKLNQAGLLMVSPANTWPGLTKKGIGEANEPMIYRPSGAITYFRIVPTDEIQGSLGAEWSKQLGAKKVFILHDRELYGKGVAEMFRRASPTHGLEVVGFEGIDGKASNYRSLAIKIRQKNPDLVYFGGTTQSNAGQIIKDVRASGLKVKFMVPDGCFENSFIESAGRDAVEGSTYITFGGVPASQLAGKGRLFYEQYRKRYGIEPESYAAYGYEAAQVVLHGIRTAATADRKSIVQAVAAIRDFDGVLGRWSFDSEGDTTLKTISGNSVKSGVFTFEKLLGQ